MEARHADVSTPVLLRSSFGSTVSANFGNFWLKLLAAMPKVHELLRGLVRIMKALAVTDCHSACHKNVQKLQLPAPEECNQSFRAPPT